MDPQHTLFLEHAWDALESSGYLGDATTTRVGVFAGISISTYLIYNLLSHPDMLETAGGLLVKHTNDKDYVATRVSYKLNLRGPSMTVQTGCSTSLVATHLACQSLLEGECDIAIAGGATINVPQCRGYLYQEGGIASPDGKCRPFDAKASGTVLTGGVGVVVLKRLGSHRGWRSHPCRHPWHGGEQRRVGEGRLHSAWRGGAGSGDSRGNGHRRCGGSRHFVHPRPRHRDASRGPDRDRCALAGVRTWNPRRPLCDRISEGQHRTREYGRGCGRAHDDRARPRTSASTADGEFREPKPRHPFADSPFYIPQTLEPWQSDGGPRIAGVSSFGMGGTNAHAVLEEPPLRPTSDSIPDDSLPLVSARTAGALEAATTRLADWLSSHPEASLADVAFTLQVGRRRFPHRRFVVCRSVEEGVAALRQPLAKPVVSHRRSLRAHHCLHVPRAGCAIRRDGTRPIRTGT